jgi:hypothetical protein
MLSSGRRGSAPAISSKTFRYSGPFCEEQRTFQTKIRKTCRGSDLSGAQHSAERSGGKVSITARRAGTQRSFSKAEDYGQRGNTDPTAYHTYISTDDSHTGNSSIWLCRRRIIVWRVGGSCYLCGHAKSFTIPVSTATGDGHTTQRCTEDAKAKVDGE